MIAHEELHAHNRLQTDPSINLRESAQDEPFRLVFLNDMHLRDRYHADEGMVACLRSTPNLECS